MEEKPIPSSTRILKIEMTGDFWKGQITPKIRLVGHWLARAGFKPGSHVQVTCSSPGILELRSVERSADPIGQKTPEVT